MSERKRVQKVFIQPSRTKQSFKQECDINHLMKKFKKIMGTEYLNRFNGYVGGHFGDFSQVVDYRSAFEQVRRAEDVFMSLPAQVRREFENDPAMFLDFCQNPANAGELVKMGLATEKPSPSADDKNIRPVSSAS